MKRGLSRQLMRLIREREQARASLALSAGCRQGYQWLKMPSSYLSAHTHSRTHVCTHTHVHVHTRAYAHTHKAAHTHKHTYSTRQICKHTHTQAAIFSNRLTHAQLKPLCCAKQMIFFSFNTQGYFWPAQHFSVYTCAKPGQWLLPQTVGMHQMLLLMQGKHMWANLSKGSQTAV